MSKAPIGSEEEGAPTPTEEGPYLSREQIREAPDLQERDVDVPEWGGKVRIRPLTIDERKLMKDRSKQRVRQPDGDWGIEYDNEEMELQAFIIGVRQPEFGQSDIAWLRKEKSGGAIQRVTLEILRTSGLGGNAEKKPDNDS